MEERETVKNIFGLPEYVEGVGNVYPVLMRDYDEFQECSSPLYIVEDNFDMEEAKKIDKDIQLLDLILLGMSNKDEIINQFKKLFSLALRKEVSFQINEFRYTFYTNDDGRVIDRNNYKKLRKVIMRQNLLFEPKIYKNKMVREWAEKVLEVKRKNGVKITIEDMITTVRVFTGSSYEEIMGLTLYQLYADFKRSSKVKEYDTSVAASCAGAEKIKIEHYAEWIDMFKSPYDDLFVDKGKLGKLNSIFQGKK